MNEGWQKPSKLFCDTNACVEVGEEDGAVLVRNSQRKWDQVSFTRDEFQAFVRAVQAGEYDAYVS